MNDFAKIVTVLILLLISLTPVFAQSGGKIVGRVIDIAEDVPMAGANVVVRGTRLGTSSDLDGEYFILRVPPGSYTVEVSFIGYKTTVIENVSVSTGLTTTLDVEMTPTAIAAGEEVIYTAERPLVRKDQTSMESHVRSEEIEAMPVESLDDVLEIQPGVTKDAQGGLHFRGGRTSEVSYLVNGISITDDYDKSKALTVANDGIAELQVISGTFNAEYGNAMSGVVNVVTKSGSNKFSGSIRAESGDYVSSRTELYPNIDNLTLSSISNISGSLSGPIIKDKVTFFVSGRRSANDGWMYGERRYLPQGRTKTVGDSVVSTLGDGGYVSMNDWEMNTGQAVVQWQITPKLILKTDFLGSLNKWRDYSHDYRYNPDGVGANEGYGHTEMARLTYMFSDKTFVEASAANRENGQSYSLYDDPLDSRYVHPDSLNKSTYAFYKSGTDLAFFDRSTRSKIIKLDMTSQMTMEHQVKAGLEFQADRVFYDDYDLIPAEDGNGVEIVPFIPSIPASSTVNHDRYTRTPNKFAIYMQDKIEYESVVINVGLRYDLFNPNGQIPIDEEDPNVYQPLKLAHKYKDTNGDGVIDISEQTEANEYSLTERERFWYKSTTVKTQLSPRLGIAYPITEQGIIHFSYGIFQQIPEYSLLYESDERKLSEGADVYGPFGNPDLEPQQTTMYEFGLAQQLTNQLAINVTGFYRDIRNWISTSAQIPTAVAGISYVTMINNDAANIRGVTLQLEGRLSDRFTVTGDYTFQVAEGTNSSPEDEYWAQLAEEQPTVQMSPLNWDQRHSLNLRAQYISSSYGLTVQAQYASGHPYTPEILTGAITGRSILAGLAENSRNMPNNFTVDILAYKVVNVMGGSVRITAQARNLFDSENPISVFNDSGLADYTANMELVPNADEGYFLRPDYYSEPRSILFGVSYEF